MSTRRRFNVVLTGTFCALLIVAGLGLKPSPAQAQIFTDLHDFNAGAGEPSNFNSGLAQGRDCDYRRFCRKQGAALLHWRSEQRPGEVLNNVQIYQP
jgi:hypothetical protein